VFCNHTLLWLAEMYVSYTLFILSACLSNIYFTAFTRDKIYTRVFQIIGLGISMHVKICYGSDVDCLDIVSGKASTDYAVMVTCLDRLAIPITVVAYASDTGHD
jgi:hypothetical protein